MKKFKELMIMLLLVPCLAMECFLKLFVVAHNAIEKVNDKLMFMAVKDKIEQPEKKEE